MLMWMLLTFLLASFSSLSTDPSSLALSNRLRLDLLVTSTTANLDLLTDSIKLHLFSAVEANSASIRINSHSDLSVVASFSEIFFTAATTCGFLGKHDLLQFKWNLFLQKKQVLLSLKSSFCYRFKLWLVWGIFMRSLSFFSWNENVAHVSSWNYTATRWINTIVHSKFLKKMPLLFGN